MKLAFRIALRFLTTNKGQTALIALGIAIGISVQIFIGSLIGGLQASLLDATIGRSPHITVVSGDRNIPLDNSAALAATLASATPEATAQTPSVTRGGFLLHDEKFEQILFRTFDLARANDIYAFENALLPGSRMPQGDEILIGSGMAEQVGLRIGDRVSLVSPERNQIEVAIVGIFDLRVAALNNTWVIGELELGQRLARWTSEQITSLEMQISEPFLADTVAARLTAELSAQPITVNNWKADNEQLLSGLSGQSTSSLMIQVFVIISVVLGIASVLAITVLQKSRQIGILKAMGLTDSSSSLVFLWQGALLGVVGGLLGIIIGIGLLFMFTSFALNPDGTPVVPILIDPMFVAFSGLLAVLAATLAALLPAQRSRQLSPMEVIRNG